MTTLRSALLTLVALVLLASPASAGNTTTTEAAVCVQKITAHTLSGGSATFTVGDNCEVQVSLASYRMPGPDFDPATVGEQVLFDSATGTFGPGPHSLSVRLPRCSWQVDLVHGPVLRKPTYAGKIIATRIGGQGDCFPPPPPPPPPPTTVPPPVTTTTVPETTTTTAPPVTDTPPPPDVPTPPAPAPVAPTPAPAPAPVQRIAATPTAPLTQLPHTGIEPWLAVAGFLSIGLGLLVVRAARRITP